jgi:hypothetical protein
MDLSRGLGDVYKRQGSLIIHLYVSNPTVGM